MPKNILEKACDKLGWTEEAVIRAALRWKYRQVSPDRVDKALSAYRKSVQSRPETPDIPLEVAQYCTMRLDKERNEAAARRRSMRDVPGCTRAHAAH